MLSASLEAPESNGCLGKRPTRTYARGLKTFRICSPEEWFDVSVTGAI